MKTEWDYTDLADAYLKRPDYAEAAIDGMLAIANVRSGKVCDVGAGVAHLTLMLANRGLEVVAIEPNDAMRANGVKRTRNFSKVSWFEGSGEQTGQPDHSFEMVTFGSSFNVTDRPRALAETKRILRPRGWFACMWNHRNLRDPIQEQIEKIISDMIPGYGYGTRREDQTAVINSSQFFGPVLHLDSNVMQNQTVAECVEAWRSHATLQRQAGSKFSEIVKAIEDYVTSLNRDSIQIPYTTNIWMARLS